MAVRTGVSIGRRPLTVLLSVQLALLPACTPAPTVPQSPPPTAAPPTAVATADPGPEQLIAEADGETLAPGVLGRVESCAPGRAALCPAER